MQEVDVILRHPIVECDIAILELQQRIGLLCDSTIGFKQSITETKISKNIRDNLKTYLSIQPLVSDIRTSIEFPEGFDAQLYVDASLTTTALIEPEIEESQLLIGCADAHIISIVDMGECYSGLVVGQEYSELEMNVETSLGEIATGFGTMIVSDDIHTDLHVDMTAHMTIVPDVYMTMILPLDNDGMLSSTMCLSFNDDKFVSTHSGRYRKLSDMNNDIELQSYDVWTLYMTDMIILD